MQVPEQSFSITDNKFTHTIMKFRKRTHKVVVSLLISASTLNAKIPNYKSSYLARFETIAVSEMKRSGVPASITLAQGILESGWGKSPLSHHTNNHFGIKCHADWKGDKHRTHSESSAEVIKTTCYRSYANAEQSYRDHTDFLLKQSLYRPLFTTHDYKDWAQGLEEAGYAHDDNYAELLTDIIETNELYRYDIELESEYSAEQLRAMHPEEIIRIIRAFLYGGPVKTALSQEVVDADWSALTPEENHWFNMGMQCVAATEPNRRRILKEQVDFDDIWI